MHNLDEVAGLLHIIEKTNDHGTQFANIRAVATRRLKVIEEETAKEYAEEQRAEKEKAQVRAQEEAERKKEDEVLQPPIDDGVPPISDASPPQARPTTTVPRRL